MEPLFQTTSEYTLEEYHKFNHTVQTKVNKLPILLAVMAAALVALAILQLLDGNIPLAVAFVILGALLPLFFRWTQGRMEKRVFASNQAMQGLVTTFTFYQDHFEQVNALGQTTLPYDKIYRTIETETNFYILLGKNQGMILIKQNCSPELVEFLHQLAAKKK